MNVGAIASIVAHGIGGRSDLPLPLWLLTYGAGLAVVASFIALVVLWPTPRLEPAGAGRRLPGFVQHAAPVVLVAGRGLGLGTLVLVWSAAAFGSRSAADNIAPTAVSSCCGWEWPSSTRWSATCGR